MTSQQNPAEARCAACGAVFDCGMQGGAQPCWCAGLPKLEPVAGRGCLCRSCFEKELAAAPPR